MNTNVLERERYIKDICTKLNNFSELKDVLSYVVDKVREISKCEAVGIRLEDNNDYPYYVYDGFSDEFINSENSIFKRDNNNNTILNAECDYSSTDCMCGIIIQGRSNPCIDYFTSKGSFWSNDITRLNISPPINNGENHRSFCLKSGYRSVSLIPIRANGKIKGLIQINDKSPNKFTLDIVEYLEMIGENIGMAITSCKNYSAMLKLYKIGETEKSQTETLDNKKELKDSSTNYLINISHELRTPVNIILNSVRLLGMYQDKNIIPKNPKVDKQLAILYKNCLRIQKLTNNLIEESKLYDGFRSTNPTKCNIITLFNEIVNSSAEYAQFKGIEIVLQGDLRDKFIVCDCEKIEYVILNLLSNAIKFSNRGDKITITIFNDEESFNFSVKDTGIGIPEDKLNSIFERFVQVDDSLTRINEGSGLGLSLVKSIVTEHDGTITAISELGKGSCFTVKLPVSPASIETYDTNDYSINKNRINAKARQEFSDLNIMEK